MCTSHQSVAYAMLPVFLFPEIHFTSLQVHRLTTIKEDLGMFIVQAADEAKRHFAAIPVSHSQDGKAQCLRCG